MSHTVISDLLRDDMQFTGLILTDALNMKGAEGYSSVDAIKAGADIVVAPNKTFTEVDRVVAAVESGQLTEEEIDSHVRRILIYKYLLGVTPDTGLHSAQGDVTPTLDSPVADSISHALRQ